MKISDLNLSLDEESKLRYILKSFNAIECKLIDRDTIFRGKTISGIGENNPWNLQKSMVGYSIIK